jgi:hypothetical protein
VAAAARIALASHPRRDDPDASDPEYEPAPAKPGAASGARAAAAQKREKVRKKPAPMPPGVPVSSLNDNDVLLGKGPQFSHYPGNFFFRDMVRQERYVTTARG